MPAAIHFPAIEEMLTMGPPSLLDEQLAKGVAHVERAIEVDVYDVPPHLGSQVDDRHPIGPPGGPTLLTTMSTRRTRP